MRKGLIVSTAAAVGLALGCVAVVGHFGYVSTLNFARHGGVRFVDVSRDDAGLSPSMRLALKGGHPTMGAGSFRWTDRGDGIETAEMPVLADRREVDRVLLVRVDASRNGIVVGNDRSWTGRSLEGWTRGLGARVVVNGSYYAPSGEPATPFLHGGERSGPQDYVAKEGALVSSEGDVAVHDLSRESWQAAFTGARDGLVSYPLLVGPDGKAKDVKASDWLANRSFVGTDTSGRLVLGTTKDAFFSLRRLAEFLATSPLNLTTTVNLDGGPLACQAVRTADFSRDFCGTHESRTVAGGGVQELRWHFGRWNLPVVIAVVPRTGNR